MSGTGYQKPPIEEALVEFKFPPDSGWDWTVPGRLQQKVAEQYPSKPVEQNLMHASLSKSAGQPMGVAVKEGVGRIQLFDTNRTRLISVGPNSLSINVLRPYGGWAEFRPRIEDALKSYREVTGARSVSRIGVRYINRIEIPRVEVDLMTYFTIYPPPPNGAPQKLAGFLIRSEYIYDQDRRALLTLASLQGSLAPHCTDVLLDLDVWYAPTTPADAASAISDTDDLHLRLTSLFEASITDATRELFNG